MHLLMKFSRSGTVYAQDCIPHLRHQVTVPWPCLTGRVLLLSCRVAWALYGNFEVLAAAISNCSVLAIDSAMQRTSLTDKLHGISPADAIPPVRKAWNKQWPSAGVDVSK